MTRGVLRKRVLLGVLAEKERRRLALALEQASVEDVARWYRARFDLLHRDDMLEFLQVSNLSHRDFSIVMRTFATVDLLEAHYSELIDQELPRHAAVLGVRDWVVRRGPP